MVVEQDFGNGVLLLLLLTPTSGAALQLVRVEERLVVLQVAGRAVAENCEQAEDVADGNFSLGVASISGCEMDFHAANFKDGI